MSTTTCRLLELEAGTCAQNMARDEAMLESAEQGVASLRFYTWSPPGVSLGYFQPASARLRLPRLQNLDWVRRPSGGATLVHHHELTYALALPVDLQKQATEPWPLRMHRILADLLRNLGAGDRVRLMEGLTERQGDVLCFQQLTPGDILCAGRKIVGSAQRKHRQCLLQHGGILLRQSEFTPELPGLLELADVELEPAKLAAMVTEAFAYNTGWKLESGTWSDFERQRTDQLVREKFAHPDWNEKR